MLAALLCLLYCCDAYLLAAQHAARAGQSGQNSPSRQDNAMLVGNVVIHYWPVRSALWGRPGPCCGWPVLWPCIAPVEMCAGYAVAPPKQARPLTTAVQWQGALWARVMHCCAQHLLLL